MSSEKKLPRDRLELLLTSRRTFVMRLRSDLMRIEDDIRWAGRYMPDGESLPGDHEAAEILRGLIALKERSISELERMIVEDGDD